MFKQLLNELFAPDPPVGGTPTTTTDEMSVNDMADFMRDDDEKETIDLRPPTTRTPPETPSKEVDEEVDETEKEEETDELAELEDELKPPTEEQLELVTPVRRREILKKYPELFKDFPYLEKAYYREQQFTELLPTIDEAKAAVEKSKILDRFESEIIGQGNTENILRAAREENPQAFLKIVDDYLPALARVDANAYTHVLANVTKHTIIAMVTEARKSNNPALQSAAQILNQYVFGSSDWKPPVQLSQETPENPQQQQINAREQELIRSGFNNTLTDLNTRVNNTLRNTIAEHIDPRKSMTEYVRKNASKDALETLNDLIKKDSRFVSLTDKLWERAVEQNFSQAAKDDIKRAYLSKARTLLPSVIKKARNDALRGMGKRVSDDDSEEQTPSKGPIAPGRPRSQSSSGKVKDAKDIPRGMKTLDFLNAD